ncbi:MAG: hypothetical protein IPF85_18865 [Anaerolineae bacterium]|nr:hypothetical protein [Anaerolineae bacterium]
MRQQASQGCQPRTINRRLAAITAFYIFLLRRETPRWSARIAAPAWVTRATAPATTCSARCHPQILRRYH